MGETSCVRTDGLPGCQRLSGLSPSPGKVSHGRCWVSAGLLSSNKDSLLLPALVPGAQLCHFTR